MVTIAAILIPCLLVFAVLCLSSWWGTLSHNVHVALIGFWIVTTAIVVNFLLYYGGVLIEKLFSIIANDDNLDKHVFAALWFLVTWIAFYGIAYFFFVADKGAKRDKYSAGIGFCMALGCLIGSYLTPW